MSFIRNTAYLFFIGSCFLVSSCDDIIEPDISKEVVVLTAPADSTRSSGSVQTFRWETVSGARQYHVQVARPSFNNPSAFFLDSLVTKASFSTALAPGSYRWRVQALNASYETAFTSRTITIDSTGSLAGQQLILLLPGNAAITASPVVTFSWTALSMAQRYLLSLQPNPRGTAGAFDTLLSTVPSVVIRLPRQSRTYQWKVTAINSFSAQQSAIRSVEIDVTAPGVSVPNAPANNEIFLNLPITFTWTRAAADVFRDSLYLYQADRQTLVATFPRFTTATSLTLGAGVNQLLPGTYHWALRSFDRAGNRSALSGLRAFVLQ